jgi:hypothetical protein
MRRPALSLLVVSACLASLAMLPRAGLGDWEVDTIPVQDTPQRVRLAPLDGDALPDLAFTAGALVPTSGVLGVLRNEGDGRFARAWGTVVPHDFNGFPGNGMPLELADLDDDGDLDLVVGGRAEEMVWLGAGDASFTPNGQIYGYGGIDDLELDDYDGDGILDVCVLNDEFGWYVDCVRGDGAGSFQTGYIGFSTVWPGHPGELTQGDVFGDDDGEPTQVVTGPAGLFMNDGLFAFTEVTDEPMVEAVVADFDADGLDDIAASAPYRHAVVVWRSLGFGDLAAPREVPAGRTPTGGIDDLDLAVCNSSDRSVSLLANNGHGAFAHAALIPVGSGPCDVFAADIDLDGDPDLAVANAGDRTISILRNPLR